MRDSVGPVPAGVPARALRAARRQVHVPRGRLRRVRRRCCEAWREAACCQLLSGIHHIMPRLGDNDHRGCRQPSEGLPPHTGDPRQAQRDPVRVLLAGLGHVYVWSKEKLTMLEIEQSLGSNICRCTGYRPILEAFKKFASDAPKKEILDIEDLTICKKSGESGCKRKCSESGWCLNCLIEAEDLKLPERIKIELKDGKSWFGVQLLADVFEVLQREGDDDYMLVAGNTAKGVYPIEELPRVLIDMGNVKELKGYHFDQNLMLGAGNTLTETMDIFEELANSVDYFWYLEKLREYLMLVAHIPVRNLGTIAGNLMTKHKHNEFQSDIFLLIETVGADLTIVDHHGIHKTVTPEEFLHVDMKGKVLLNILFPPLSRSHKFVSFKVMPRAQNAHAIVNAAFLYKLSTPKNVVSSARMVFGGLSSKFVRAKNTEKFLIGRQLFSNKTLQGAIQVLMQELVVVDSPPEPSAKYRMDLAVNLFYKGLLSLCPGSTVSPKYASGGIVLSKTRPVSDGKQVYNTDQTLWPLNQPVEKVEALIQCSGEAPYTEDVPGMAREVFGAFVLAKVPVGDIDNIDATEALQHPGVLAFYSAKDIPGVNSFTPGDNAFFLAQEEVFCSGSVKYNGQVIGLIVAETRTIAEYASKLVEVRYKNVQKPVTDIKVAKKDTNRAKLEQAIPATSKGSDVAKVIKGEETMYQQKHFCMEALVSVTKPTEEGMEVHCTTQHMDGVQYMISRALKMPENKIDVHVRRLGGAYGIKISRGNQVAVACALVTQKLNRPCRIILSLKTQSHAVGKRLPCSTEYEVAVDATGRIQYCNENLYMDHGYIVDEPLMLATLDVYNNCYEKARFDYKVFNVTTDTASNTWCRSPGTLEAIASAELIMERISYELSQDPFEVRLQNLDPAYTDLKDQVDRIRSDGQYTERRAFIDKFNSQNRWKKRGLRASFLRWQPLAGQYFDLTLSVYHDDGTVTLTHGGIEMGQGLNTKTVQIAAHLLGLSLDKIQIKGNNTIINPNGFISGGSLTSINIGIGVQRCCEELLTRLEPIRKENPDATWETLIKTAFNANVDLQTHGFVSMSDTQAVNVYGVTLSEVEMDVLTGEWEVIRVDVLEDAGQSVSPSIDVGQVEGAFIMGLGYWTCEQLVINPETGELLTDRTWTYHVPQARDIPQDFRVYFQDKSYSESRILGAKSIGEPAICMSVSVAFALREAIMAARSDAGQPANQWLQIDAPYTREKIQQNTATEISDFKLY
ncbi:indole-3-acetaldehyde oxidase-like isoform X2 [Leguminivora glycinivorella]|uniref:indole-3-acetaldehyde oxidase-like isoform X2 n=1 Tax=Leguminivora glycinivorella TaxID=1035111 RepID=UPI0020108407|nr:indole-3-acetaldehyde oxidase-like isoform X2 [Leguminivora glycinivorella]